ncbi:MAG: TIGR01212 family radical SAM protein [Cellulosilyticaceae bacterium]
MAHQQPFYSLNTFLRERHGEKVIKLSIDGGFTCPNRDGTVGTGGCIFCSAEGSGDFASPCHLSIADQLASATAKLSQKWGDSQKYFAYFQSYSNTYAPLDTLKAKYEEALMYPGVVGLAIATRPDCISDETLDYLELLSKRTHLWVELGLQTIHPHTSSWMNRGHDLQCFDQQVTKLTERGIEVVAHMILGFPGETKEHMLQTAAHLATLPLQGIKIHMLHILDNSPLGRLYLQKPFELLSEDAYIQLLGEILPILPSHFVIHRLTGDGDKNHLLAPLWTTNKRQVLNHIHQYFKSHNIFQGHIKNTY